MGIELAILGSSLIGGISSKMAGDKQAKAAKKAQQLQAQQFQEIKGLHQPYVDAGTNALVPYLTSVGLYGDTAEQRNANQAQYFEDFQYDPGFQNWLDRTMDTTMRSYSLYGDTGGNLANSLRERSGEAIYGQFQDRRNQLGGLVDTGRSAAGSLAGFGQQNATAQSNSLTAAGNAKAQGILGMGQAGVNALSGLGQYGMYQQGYNASQNPWAAQTVNRAMI